MDTPRNLPRARILLAALPLLVGCSLDPTYQRPASPVQTTWPTGAAYRTPEDSRPGHASADEIGWRDVFRAPALQSLVAGALANNRDLRIAALNVEAQQAQVRIQRADLLPVLDAGGSDTQGRSASGSSASYIGTRSVTLGGIVSAWEIDLFGRVRSLTRQAAETALSLEETRRATQITLVGQVATAWLTLLGDQQQLDLAQRTLASQRASYELVARTFDGGTATALALRQAQTSVETASASVAQYTRLVAQDRNALELLVAGPLPAGSDAPRSLAGSDLLGDLPTGVASDLLLRRPDVLAAEHVLRGANASIGAARAAFFPSIILTASGGTASRSLSGLFGAGSAVWAFSPQITVPIFTAGANAANLDYATLQRDINVATYERTIQTAFREVADALAARGTYDAQITAQAALVAAYEDSYRLSELRFRNGVDSFLSVLDSQRNLYAAQRTLIDLQVLRLQATVALYKALGGGWVEQTPIARQPPQGSGAGPR